MRLMSVLAVCLVTACVPSPGAEVSMSRSAGLSAEGLSVPSPLAGQSAGRPSSASRSNEDIARDFMDLTFRMESGRLLPVLSRFEGPITVRATGQIPASGKSELTHLLNRFRNEARLNIREITSGPASINVEFVPRSSIQQTYSNVACFVVPRVSSWEEFRQSRHTRVLNWASVTQRDRVAVFVPADSSAQEIRDCLHEEMAQAMGPLNDLYRLSDSVFNDDNFNTTLTGFDMVILRAFYAPELKSGMSQKEVAAHLPAILARVNPAGRYRGGEPTNVTPRFWINAIEIALTSGNNMARRQASARQALATAKAQGWNDGRLAFSYFALGRLTLAKDPEAALSYFDAAGKIYRRLPGGQIHAAHVDMQFAAYALTQGQATKALGIVDASMPVVSRAQNAALMATMLFIKTEALSLLGRDAEARAVRIDSQRWARYGFGTDAQIRARSAEIAALARRAKKG